jgi:UvrD-like helicase C-terminal domain
VLRTNYRNAANILAASAQLVIDDDYNDLDDEYEHGRRDVVAVRDDGQVWTVNLASIDELRTGAVAHIRNLLSAGHAIAGIALLCASNAAVKTYLRLLSAAEITAINLADYVGRPVAAVKVGTYQRAKGLEFKDVVLPVHPRASAARSDDGRQEARELENRALFVAMTRARDTLWVGRVGAHQPHQQHRPALRRGVGNHQVRA